MNIQDRIVVGRDDAWHFGLVETEIRLARVGPPRLEGRRMETGPVSVVMEPQTETRAAQSKRPDLRVLAMTTLWPLLPLVRQV